MNETTKIGELTLEVERLKGIITNTQKSAGERMNEILCERDKLRKEVRDLTLQNQALLKFKESITKSLDKIIKDLGEKK